MTKNDACRKQIREDNGLRRNLWKTDISTFRGWRSICDSEERESVIRVTISARLPARKLSNVQRRLCKRLGSIATEKPIVPPISISISLHAGRTNGANGTTINLFSSK